MRPCTCGHPQHDSKCNAELFPGYPCGCPQFNERPIRYGFYSAAAVDHGTNFYMKADGSGEVEVTAISESPRGDDYCWPDKVAVGEVGDWTRAGRARGA